MCSGVYLTICIPDVFLKGEKNHLWPSNSKTGYCWPLNYQKYLYLAIQLFWNVVWLTWMTHGSGIHMLAYFSLSSFISMLSLFVLSLLSHQSVMSSTANPPSGDCLRAHPMHKVSEHYRICSIHQACTSDPSTEPAHDGFDGRSAMAQSVAHLTARLLSASMAEP